MNAIALYTSQCLLIQLALCVYYHGTTGVHKRSRGMCSMDTSNCVIFLWLEVPL